MAQGAIRKPEKRICERCGRREIWDKERETWRVQRVDGKRRQGGPYCLHEWDINGTFAPFEYE